MEFSSTFTILPQCTTYPRYLVAKFFYGRQRGFTVQNKFKRLAVSGMKTTCFFVYADVITHTFNNYWPNDNKNLFRFRLLQDIVVRPLPGIL